MALHSSNLRPLKRIDLLLETAARIRPRELFKLVILAGGNFAPFAADVQRLELEDRVIVRENVLEVEDYLQAADLGLFTSETERVGVSSLEAMYFACPSVATRVGGIPEVLPEYAGMLVPPCQPDVLAFALVEACARAWDRRAIVAHAARFRWADNIKQLDIVVKKVVADRAAMGAAV